MRTKGALSQLTAKPMAVKLVKEAAESRRRLPGQDPMPKVIAGVTFRSGVAETPTSSRPAA